VISFLLTPGPPTPAPSARSFVAVVEPVRERLQPTRRIRDLEVDAERRIGAFVTATQREPDSILVSGASAPRGELEPRSVEGLEREMRMGQLHVSSRAKDDAGVVVVGARVGALSIGAGSGVRLTAPGSASNPGGHE
jgi:hypothetical protein